MGRIDKIVVNNFKSYAGEQTIGPFVEGFTCVVGPNGAGKSNVMDAICFVLGVNAKNIRADKLKDLVFKVEGKPGKVNEASVTMHYVLTAGEIENYTEDTVLEFMRTVTAKGTSEYFIQGNKLDAKDYSTALAELRIDTKARNFLVFQGDVGQLADKSSAELVAYFELVSGSAELKPEYELTQTQLEEARQLCNQKKKIAQEASKEKVEVLKHKESAELYKKLSDDIEKLQTQIALTRLFFYEAQIATEEARHETAQRATAAATAQEVELMTELSAFAKTAAGAQKAALKKTAQADSKAKDVLNAEGEVKRLEERLKTLKSRLNNAGSDEKAAVDAVTALTAQVSGLEEELTELKDQLEGMSGAATTAGTGSGAGSKSSARGKGGKKAPVEDAMDVEQAAGFTAGGERASLDDKDRAEYTKLKAQERAETADDREVLDRLKREQDDGEAEAGKQRTTLEAASKRVEEIQASISTKRERKDKIASALSSAKSELTDKQADLASVKQEHKKAEARMQDVGNELEEVKAALAQLQAAASKSDAEKKAEHAVAELRRLYPGVRGRMTELVSLANKKLSLAVTVALGKHADSVVVDKESVAHDCMRWLREHRVKPMTFIPLDTVKPKDVSEAILTAVAKNDSQLKLARECVTYSDEGLEKAVAYAFGSTLVCETMNLAMDLRYKKGLEAKIVTHDGTVIAKNGNMTGGQGERDEIGKGAARWDEKELRKAEVKRTELLQEEETLRRKLSRGRGAGDTQSLLALMEQTETELANLQRKISSLDKAVKDVSADINAESADLAVAQKEVDDASPKLAAVKKALEQRAASMAQLQSKIDKVADGLFKELCSKLGISSIRDYEQRHMARAEAESKRRAGLTDAIAKLQSKIDYERSRLRDAESKLARVRKDGGDSGSEKGQLEKELVTAQAKLASLKAEEAALRAEAEKAREEEKVAGASRDKLNAQRTELAKKRAENAKSASVSEIALEKLRLERHDLLTLAQMDKIHLPARDRKAAAPAATSKRGGRTRGGRAAAQGGEEEDEAMDETGAGEAQVFTQRDSQTDDITMSTTDVLNGPNSSVAAKDQERSDRVDYSLLPSDWRDGLSSDPTAAQQSVDHRVKQLETEISSSKEKMSKLNVNFKAVERLEEVLSRAAAAVDEEKKANSARNGLESKFTALRTQRLNILMDTYKATAAVLPEIYKELTRDKMFPQGGEAQLSMLSEGSGADPWAPEEGLRYIVTPPGKQYRAIEGRSGGEKTMASLALLFALQAARPSPFFIMDEIDAALDNVNVQKVVAHVRKRARGQAAGSTGVPLQMIVISLKDIFYEKADRLIGIYKENSQFCSRVLTMHLADYPQEVVPGGGACAGGTAQVGEGTPGVRSMAPPSATRSIRT